MSTSSQNIRLTYDRFSSVYDLLFKDFLENGRELAVAELSPARGSRVLELGIGTGLSLEFYPPDVKVIAFDYSFGMLKVLSENIPESFKSSLALMQMDAQKMAFVDHSFNYVFAAYVLTVVEHPESVIKELFRVAKPGAKVVLVNHLRSKNRLLETVENFFHPIVSKSGLFTLDRDIISMLKQHGATNIKTRPTSIFKTHHIISFNTPLSVS